MSKEVAAWTSGYVNTAAVIQYSEETKIAEMLHNQIWIYVQLA